MRDDSCLSSCDDLQEATHDWRCVPVAGLIVLPDGMTLASQLGAHTAVLVPQLDNCLAATLGHTSNCDRICVFRHAAQVLRKLAAQQA
ncbi:hypothetical protein P3T17_004188 [Paraburkholderia sp. GAS82]